MEGESPRKRKSDCSPKGGRIKNAKVLQKAASSSFCAERKRANRNEVKGKDQPYITVGKIRGARR